MKKKKLLSLKKNQDGSSVDMERARDQARLAQPGYDKSGIYALSLRASQNNQGAAGRA